MHYKILLQQQQQQQLEVSYRSTWVHVLTVITIVTILHDFNDIFFLDRLTIVRMTNDNISHIKT